MMRTAQASDVAKMLVGGGISIALSFLLFAIVQVQTDLSGSQTGMLCYPQWKVGMGTRSILETERGQPLRAVIGRRLTESGFSAADTLLEEITRSIDSQTEWVWMINGEKGGLDGLTEDGQRMASSIFNNRDPVSYTYEGKTVEIMIVAIDTTNYCEI